MSNQVFGSRAGNVRHLLRTIQLQTGGSYALIAYRGNNDDPHRVVDANPSVEEVQARLGYEPNPEPVELIDRVVAHEHLQELTNEQLLELENLLDTILHLVRTEQEVRAAAASRHSLLLEELNAEFKAASASALCLGPWFPPLDLSSTTW